MAQKQWAKTGLAFGLLALASCRTNTPRTAARFVDDNAPAGRQAVIPLDVFILGGPARNEKTARTLDTVTRHRSYYNKQSQPMSQADMGLAAFYANDGPKARQLLDAAVQNMCCLTLNKSEEMRVLARQTWEASKRFKGEPYERTMVLLHRGILYLADGDLDNAHSCFLEGMLQDISTNATAQADWASLDLLALVSKRLRGMSNAEDQERRIRDVYRPAELPEGWALPRTTPVAVLIAVGPPPRKLALGDRGQLLGFEEVSSVVSQVCVSADAGLRVAAPMADNTFVQAVTRGRRHMDDVLAGRAAAQSRLDTAGRTSDVLGRVASGASGIVPVLIPVALVMGITAQYFENEAKAVHPRADTRQVESAPGRLFLAFLDERDIKGQLRIELFDGERRKVAEGTVDWTSHKGRGGVVVARFPY